LFSPSHQNALTSASKLGPQHDKKISADLFKQNAAKFSPFCCFVLLFQVHFFCVFYVDAAGPIFGASQFTMAKRPAPKRAKVWPIPTYIHKSTL